LIDSHTHIYLQEFDTDRSLVIERAKMAGVNAMLMPNVDLETINPMLLTAKEYPNYCIPMMGLHPTSVTAQYKKQLAIINNHLAGGCFIAVGEIGIDLYWDTSLIKEQMDAFDIQIKMALRYDLPVVIHSRNALPQIYEVLETYKGSALKGVFHSFAESAAHVAKIQSLGDFYFGINGVVTFKKTNISEALQAIGLNRVLLETDAPYLTPVPFRGKRNESAYLNYITDKLAKIFGKNSDTIKNVTSENATELFNLRKYVH